MGDPGFISGMIGCAIQLAVNQIIDHINIAVRCRKELDALKLLVEGIQTINMEMQEYRKALNSGKIINASSHHSLHLQNHQFGSSHIRSFVIRNTFGSSHIRSFVIRNNLDLKEIPQQVIGRMMSLRVLDLSRTALHSLPKSIGCLKCLVCLRVSYTPIKTLPNSITALTNLQILNLYGTDITELPSGISKLTSLQLLEIGSCEHLQSVPYGVSQLTASLEYLNIYNCTNNAWINKRKGELLSINDLRALKQLKRLVLANNGEIIVEGTLGSMKQSLELDKV